MSTKSIIGIQNANGTIQAIFCHWSGQPTQNGVTLLQHYTSEEKIRQLLALGNISVLGEHLTPKAGQPHHATKGQENTVLAYGRDWGKNSDTGIQWKSAKDLTKEVAKYIDAKYYYIWTNGTWLCAKSDNMQFITIEQAQKEYTFNFIKKLLTIYAEVCPRLENGYIDWKAVKLQPEYKVFENDLNRLHFVTFTPHDFNTVSKEDRTLKVDFLYKNEWFTINA